MNETYWVVVKPSGWKLYRNIRLYRNIAIQDYIWECFGYQPSKKQTRQFWRKQYRKGARCKKVRLVLEE